MGLECFKGIRSKHRVFNNRGKSPLGRKTELVLPRATTEMPVQVEDKRKMFLTVLCFRKLKSACMIHVLPQRGPLCCGRSKHTVMTMLLVIT